MTALRKIKSPVRNKRGNKHMNRLIKKLFNRETILYVVFGVLTTAVDYAAAYVFFYRLNWSEVLSNTVAWVLAVAFAYITNKLFVFEASGTDAKTLVREIAAFAGARVITLIITDIFLIFTSKAGIPFMLSKLVISVVVIVLNYIFSKLFIFKNTKNGE